MSTPQLVSEIPQHCLNEAWIASHSDELYQVINDALQHADTIDTGTDALLMVFPRLMALEDLKTWHSLIQKALRKAIDARPRRSSRNGQDAFIIGDGFIVERLDHGAVEIMPSARRRPRFRLNPRKLFEDYLLLLTSLIYRNGLTLNEERIADLVRFARRVNHPHTTHKCYQALAFIYNHLGQFKRAAAQADLAYVYFLKHDNALEAGLTAYARACSSFSRRLVPEARHWLEAAANHLARTEYIGQYGAIPLMEANLDLVERDYESAAHAAAQALDEYQMMNLQGRRGHFYRALSYQTLGGAQSMLGQMEDATTSLNKALGFWEKADDPLRYTETSFSLVFVEGKGGDESAARDRLAAEKARLQEQPESAHRDHLLAYHDRLLAALDKGTIDELFMT